MTRQAPARRRWLILGFLTFAFAQTIHAQDINVIHPQMLADEIAAAFDRDDYAQAATLCERFLDRWPNHPTMLYNAACAQAQLGNIEEAATHLYRSVEAGFTDFAHMESDSDLAPLRDHPVYVRIMDARNAAFSKIARRQLERAREQFPGESYHHEIDMKHRLAYAVALDQTSFHDMREMLSRQANFLAETLFEAPPNYFVLVAVPTPADASKMLPNAQIGGIYEHGKRRLIARDIGMMLRHEFTHLMHYGHMSRLNQPHALWVQEGIAALFESYEVDASGRLMFTPNNRHNLTKRMVHAHASIDWDTLLEMSSETFMDRSGKTYPQVRSIFRWLAEREKLIPWYRAYVEHFAEDTTGRKAFEVTFDETLDKTERRWRSWVMGQSFRDDVVTRGDASLGVQVVADGQNDGVLIDAVFASSAAAEAGLAPGDVIVAIDDRPTRAPEELIEIIAAHNVGDVVEVRFRRDGVYRTVRVQLKPLRIGHLMRLRWLQLESSQTITQRAA